MNKFFKTILLTTIIIFLGFSSGCTNKDLSARSRISDLSEIDIPSNSEIVFNHKEDVFFPVPGRRTQYTVFEFEELPIEFLHDENFQDEKDVDFEELFDWEFISFSHTFDIPNEYHPNWDIEYLWLDTSSGIYFVYFIESNLLIVYIVGN